MSDGISLLPCRDDMQDVRTDNSYLRHIYEVGVTHCDQHRGPHELQGNENRHNEDGIFRGRDGLLVFLDSGGADNKLASMIRCEVDRNR